MNEVISAREEALRDLLHRRVPVQDAVRELTQFPWDSEKELVQLTKVHVVSVLEAFVAGDVDADEVETWAEAVQGREDVSLRHEDADLLRDALFELSTPELFGPPARTVPELLKRAREA